MTWQTRKLAKDFVQRLLFLIVSSSLLGCAGYAQHYPILPVPDSPHGIFTMMQDRESRIWLGTIDNVYSFDGKRFYSLRGAGFPHELPNSYAEDGTGAIWIGTQGTDAMGGTEKGGLYRYHDGHVEKILSGDVLGLIAAGNDAVLASFGTEGSAQAIYGDLYLFHNQSGRWSADKLIAKTADYMSADHQHNILFACPGGWCEIAEGAIDTWIRNRQPIVPVRHPGSALVERVLRDRYGCVWFRAETFSSYQCPTDPVPVRLSNDISETDTSAHLEETADGSIFMLVRMALGRPGHFHIANRDNGLPDAMDTAMVARDGTIWIGSANGLYRFMYPFQLQLWDRSNGVGPPSTLMRFGGTVFAADHGLTALTADETSWHRLPAVEGLSDTAAASTDRLYVLGSSGLIGLALDKAVKSVTSAPKGGFSTILTAERDRTFWLGADGIYRIRENDGRPTLHQENLPGPAINPGSPQADISDIKYQGVNGVIWACNGKRILYDMAGAWHQITQKDGLPDAACAVLAPLPDGNLWVGYNPSQYSYIQSPLSEHPSIRNFSPLTNKPIADSGVELFAADMRGRLWMERADSLFVARYDAVQSVAQQGNWLRLDGGDGMNVTGASTHAFLADSDGSVWFATETGVAHFLPPDDFASSFPVPQVFISGFSSGNNPPLLASAVRNLSRSEPVQAFIGSLQFNRRSALQIRYRLLPSQTSWITTSDLDIALGKPGWGKHTLEVQARLSSGPWSNTVAQSITVPPPFWFTWQGLSGFSLGGFALIAGGAYWRRRAREREAKLNRALPDLAELRLSTLSPELQQLDGRLLDGRFEVGRLLARGGFAVVTDGRDHAERGRRCAIKIFRRELGDQAWIDRRFRQEVLALEKIRHPNVVRIYGSGILPIGTMYLVMEFIEGVTLREKLETARLPLPRVAAYLRQIGSALNAVHSVGICHRDLKPDNLMLRNDAPTAQELVLIDFSIAIVKDADKTVCGLSRAAGTISYMAPEQAIGYADPATDIYSLVKVIVEMLAGERLANILPDASMDLPERVVELLKRLHPALSPEVLELLASALQFDPALRPHDASQFTEQVATGLERCAEIESAATLEVSASPEPSRKASEPDEQ